MSNKPNLSGIKPNVDEWKLIDAFNSTYWSGQDVNVYFNDIYIEDAVQLNYQVIEQVRPYYGYASYTVDRMHHGARMISGEFTMNFRQEGQIYALLQAIRRGDSIYDRALTNANMDMQKDAILSDADSFTTNDWTAFTDQINDIDAATLSEIVKAKKKKQNQVLQENRNRVQISSYQSIFETNPEGFTISVMFGANLDNALSLSYINDVGYTVQPYKAQSAKFDPYYGEGTVLDNDGVQRTPLMTGIAITGVSIMGAGKAIDDSGRGLVETYTFQARDVRILNPRLK